MCYILNIDSSSTNCSVSLSKNGELLSLKEKNYDENICAMVAHVHDELQLQCKSSYADEVGQLAVQSIKDAGTHFNFRCPLDAEYKIGNTWAETH